MVKKAPALTLGDLAQRIGGELVGESGRVVTGMRPLNEATEEDVAFLDPKNAKMLAALPGSLAAAVIVGRAFQAPSGKNAIRIDPPHLGLARALAILYPRRRAKIGVSPAAHLEQGVKLGEGVNVYPGAYLGAEVLVGDRTDIFPGVYVGPGSTIGTDCILYPNVTVYEHTRIGHRVIIHAGAVIGADGFGFVPEPVADNPREPVRHAKIPQVGHVVIEDDVEIGANTTIDRATLSATVIGRGTKIDNLVMFGHNSSMGRHGVIVAQAGVSGSTEIGNYVTIAGQAGLVGHITVGDRAVIAAQAGVTKDVGEGKTVLGSPAMDIREGRLAYGLIARLPEIKKSLADLHRRVERIEGA